MSENEDSYQDGVVCDTNRDECCHMMARTDATLIVAAVNALPALLAVYEAAVAWILDEDRDPPVPMSYARTLATVVIAQHAEIEQLRAALREACELAMFTHPREFDLSARIAELRKLAGET